MGRRQSSLPVRDRKLKRLAPNHAGNAAKPSLLLRLHFHFWDAEVTSQLLHTQTTQPPTQYLGAQRY